MNVASTTAPTAATVLFQTAPPMADPSFGLIVATALGQPPGTDPGAAAMPQGPSQAVLLAMFAERSLLPPAPPRDGLDPARRTAIDDRSVEPAIAGPAVDPPADTVPLPVLASKPRPGHVSADVGVRSMATRGPPPTRSDDRASAPPGPAPVSPLVIHPGRIETDGPSRSVTSGQLSVPRRRTVDAPPPEPVAEIFVGIVGQATPAAAAPVIAIVTPRAVAPPDPAPARSITASAGPIANSAETPAATTGDGPATTERPIVSRARAASTLPPVIDPPTSAVGDPRVQAAITASTMTGGKVPIAAPAEGAAQPAPPRAAMPVSGPADDDDEARPAASPRLRAASADPTTTDTELLVVASGAEPATLVPPRAGAPQPVAFPGDVAVPRPAAAYIPVPAAPLHPAIWHVSSSMARPARGGVPVGDARAPAEPDADRPALNPGLFPVFPAADPTPQTVFAVTVDDSQPLPEAHMTPLPSAISDARPSLALPVRDAMAAPEAGLPDAATDPRQPVAGRDPSQIGWRRESAPADGDAEPAIFDAPGRAASSPGVTRPTGVGHAPDATAPAPIPTRGPAKPPRAAVDGLYPFAPVRSGATDAPTAGPAIVATPRRAVVAAGHDSVSPAVVVPAGDMSAPRPDRLPPPLAAQPATPFTPVDGVVLRPDRLARDLGVAIARQLGVGGPELRVSLDPAELGRIDVRMTFNDQGVLRTVVATDSSTVLDLLRRDSGDLGRAMTDAGVRADGQSFRFESTAGDQRSAGDGQPRGQRHPHDPPRHQPKPPVADEFRPLRWSGGLDVTA